MLASENFYPYDLNLDLPSMPPELQVRNAAQDHILQYYPLWRQLNILRNGVASEIATMGAFIDAVRAWSNAATPDLAALRTLLP